MSDNAAQLYRSIKRRVINDLSNEQRNTDILQEETDTPERLEFDYTSSRIPEFVTYLSAVVAICLFIGVLYVLRQYL